MENNVMMGKRSGEWRVNEAKSIIFCVTEDCNLACKYCYMTGKNSKSKMTFNIAKKAVDTILSNREFFNEKAVIWEFIGGEPFLEIELIDQISDYIKLQMYLTNHPWFDSYRFNISTNGLLYHTGDVQNYVKKNRGHLSIGFSIDGNKIKHDLQRVKPDGSGSYDDVIKNVPLWMEQFPESGTKATFAYEDIKYLKDSIISLWKLGIRDVSANIIFEDVWREGIDILFEKQLMELADYILSNDLWEDYNVRFFDPTIGYPLSSEELKKNFCGSGRMLAIDCRGIFYPCVRFYDMSLNNRKGRKIGDIYNGIDENRIRPFLALSLESQSRKECIECQEASGCAWCTGCNYDMAETDTIFQRATYICKMHKANVRANKYFWGKFSKNTGLPSKRIDDTQKDSKNSDKYLYLMTSDKIIPHCMYKNTNNWNKAMPKEVFGRGLEYAKINGFVPVVLGSSVKEFVEYQNENEIIYIVDREISSNTDNSIVIFDNNVDEIIEKKNQNCILLVNNQNINRIYKFIEALSCTFGRINLILQDIDTWDNYDINLYEIELERVIDLVYSSYSKRAPLELNVLTDILNLKSSCKCGVGISSYTLAPNGKIYLCPAFYFENINDFIGDIYEGEINIKSKSLLEENNLPICSTCDVYHCLGCKHLNKKLTLEVNIPSKIQCVIGHIERSAAKKLQELLLRDNLWVGINKIKEIDYTDPLTPIIRRQSKSSW